MRKQQKTLWTLGHALGEIEKRDETIARLLAANKKLRKELSVAKVGLDQSRRYAERMCAEGETLERVVEMFAKAICGKAK